MPRTGLPDFFPDAADYERYVATMMRCGAIADASYLWWTLRLSIHYPTLELRVADRCTWLEDTLAIVALYRCLVRLAVRKPELNRGLTGASRALVSENLWRAQRDGTHANFLDEQTGTVMPVATYLDAIIAEIAEEADVLGCQSEIERARAIAREGTSADRQLAVFASAPSEIADASGSLGAVVVWIAGTTAKVSAAST